jgi:hypothetical protein
MTDVVVLCGSTRFKHQFESEARRLTLAGSIVVTLGIFGHSEGIELSAKTKQMLGHLQRQRIDMASRVHVINVGGYIGISTAEEIEYAKEHGKMITYLEAQP